MRTFDEKVCIDTNFCNERVHNQDRFFSKYDTDHSPPSESQMSLKIITVGDKTDHGGTVISGSPDHDIRGKAIARLGDKVSCPQVYPGGKPHGVNKIITAHNTLTVNGVPVAVEGCITECGCKLIGSLPATVD
jgi:uncharacterized Zn-binding protein involved in type VI secretion